jgi:hypothetical protein
MKRRRDAGVLHVKTTGMAEEALVSQLRRGAVVDGRG